MFMPRNHFDCFLNSLKRQEEILKELDQLEPSHTEKSTVEKGLVDFFQKKRVKKASRKNM